VIELSVPVRWEPFLGEEAQKPYMTELAEFLRKEQSGGKVIRPNPAYIFRALEMVDYSKVRAVILGQDPYHGQNQANGLAFAVHADMKTPPSLVNIFKEIETDLGRKPSDQTLVSWARQGVLLLNTVLTTRQGEAFAHRGKGWETFTDKIIEVLGAREKPMIFLLWGDAAQSKMRLIKQQHHVLKAPHPSPLSAYRGFLGCKHFSKANEALLDAGMYPINWTTQKQNG
jgi:uracil-DNA glycosylase